MDREKLKELIMDSGEIASAVGMQEWVVEKIADYLIANGIGDITAETRKWDTLCNKIGDIIADGHDCEDGCWQEFLDIVNEIKRYDGSYYNQLAAERNRADVAEEAYNQICDFFADSVVANDDVKIRLLRSLKNNFRNKAEEIIRKAAERLKEKQ